MNLLNAQTIQLISKNTQEPLPKVSVIGKDGNILAYSDIEGKINLDYITKDQEEFQLIYDNESIAKLPYSSFLNPVIYLNDRVKEIEAVIIKKGEKAKYIHVTGNFTTYVTLNNGLNSYADGVATYIYDRETGKLKSTNVLQYRIYKNEKATNEKKKVATYEYDAFLKLPDLKNLRKLENFQDNGKKIKQLKGADRDIIEETLIGNNDKTIAFLGYRLTFKNMKMDYSYNKNSNKKIEDVLAFSEVLDMELKHKSEETFTDIIVYKNFYVTQIDYNKEKNIEHVSFNKSKSNFKEKYWDNAYFPNLQLLFNSYFRDDLKLK